MAEEKQIVIDVHTHIFNSLYLPLKGIFTYKFKLPFPVSWALEVVLITLTSAKHILPAEEIWNIDTVSPGSGQQIIDNMFQMVKEELLKQSFYKYSNNENIEDIDLYSALVEIENYYNSKIGSGRNIDILDITDVYLLQDVKEQRDTFFNVIDDRFHKPFHYIMKKLDTIGVEDTNDFCAIGSSLKFFYLMISKEKTIVKQLQSTKSKSSKVVLYIHHMMDMEKSFGKIFLKSRPHYSYEKKQIKRMAKIAKSNNGRILGFVATHPKRRNTYKTVLRGLRSGNIGVKIYPPLGYTPDFDNKRQRKIFKHCEDYQIPLLTHCTPVGFEARKCYGLKADPQNWENVLEKCRKLPLCLGHAGGGFFKFDCKKNETKHIFYGWLAPTSAEWDQENYAQKVVELCLNYPNVYCDFSHLHQILDVGKKVPGEIRDKTELTTFKIVQNRLISILSNHPEFGKKIMYGSDWHMVKMLNRTDSFLESFQTIFSHDELKEYSDDFFYKNALRWLNIPEFISRHKKENPDFLNDETIDYLQTLLLLLPPEDH